MKIDLKDRKLQLKSTMVFQDSMTVLKKYIKNPIKNNKKIRRHIISKQNKRNPDSNKTNLISICDLLHIHNAYSCKTIPTELSYPTSSEF